MQSRFLIPLVVLSLSLAGCGGDKETGPSAEELCDGIYADGVCTPHTEPHVTSDLPAEVTAYTSIDFTWGLDNGTRGMDGAPVHSMDSRLLTVTDGSAPDNMTEPDSFGKELAKQEHKNLPDNFTAKFQWDAENVVVTVWGYMRIDGVNVWNIVQNITINSPVATGQTKTVTFSQGPPAAASPSEITLALGDAIQFDNEHAVYGYDISFSCNNGVTASDVTVGASSMSASTTFLKPTVCSWEAVSPLTAAGQDLSGTLRVVSA